MSAPIDIKGLDRAELLQALHAGTRAVGFGMLHDRGPLTVEECRDIIAGGRGPDHNPDLAGIDGSAVRFDYVAGRPIKVTFEGGELRNAWLYDRDAPTGEGTCARIVEEIRRRKNLRQEEGLSPEEKGRLRAQGNAP